MKNGKIKLNKTKIIARVMLVVLLFAGTLNLAGCGNKIQVDLNKQFNIDDGTINFLCMRSISKVFTEYGIRTHRWNSGYYDEGLYIVDGKEHYTRPHITYNATILSSDLGDGRTFYQKYINKYISMHGSYMYSIKISADSYAFQGELGEIRYEIDEYKLKGKKISIYNNNELIGETTVITKLKLSDDFYRDLLNKTLFVITVDKYSKIERSQASIDEEIKYLEPNLDIMQLSFLSIRDIRNDNDTIELSTYKTKVLGGYSGLFGRWLYDSAVNELDLEFYDKTLKSNIKIETEFYEYRVPTGEIEYVFVADKEKGKCVELYTNSCLVGKIFYSSDAEISQDWLIDFLNENLVVININK